MLNSPRFGKLEPVNMDFLKDDRSKIDKKIFSMKQQLASKLLYQEKKIVVAYTESIEQLKKTFELEFKEKLRKNHEYFDKQLHIRHEAEEARVMIEKIEKENAKIKEVCQELQMTKYVQSIEQELLSK